MESKQIWMTIAVAVIISVVVSWIVSASILDPQLAPARLNGSNPINSSQKLPDLIVSRIDFNGAAGGGGGSCGSSNGTIYCSHSLFVTVKNIGPILSSSSILQVTVPDGNNTYINLANISSLSPGQSQEVDLGTGSHISGFNYTAFAFADVFNQVSESNENNNVDSYNFQL